MISVKALLIGRHSSSAALPPPMRESALRLGRVASHRPVPPELDQERPPKRDRGGGPKAKAGKRQRASPTDDVSRKKSVVGQPGGPRGLGQGDQSYVCGSAWVSSR